MTNKDNAKGSFPHLRDLPPARKIHYVRINSKAQLISSHEHEIESI
jgi:hypothetical protein